MKNLKVNQVRNLRRLPKAAVANNGARLCGYTCSKTC